MNEKLKGQGGYIKQTVLLTVFALLLGIGAALMSQLGLILVPPLAAVLAALYSTDKTKHRIVSIVISTFTVAAEILFNLYLSFNCLSAIILALIIVFGLRLGFSKSVCAAVGTVFIAVVIAAYLLFSAFYEIKAFDLKLASDYLVEMVEQIRAELTLYLEGFVRLDTAGNYVPMLDVELIEAALDTYLAVIPSVFVVFAFAIVGLAFKLFSAIIRKCDGAFALLNGGWVFGTSALFAYFYLALSFLQLFIGAADVLAVAMLNLYVVFMAVYAYVGFRFASFLLTRATKKPLLSKFLVLLSLLFFSQFAIQILSYAGVFETVMTARIKAANEHDDTNLTGG